MQTYAHSSGFRLSLRPLLRLPLRASAGQPDSGYSLYSRARDHPPLAAALTDPVQGDPLASTAPPISESAVGQGECRSVSSECAASTSDAASGLCDAAEHNNQNPSSRTATASDTLMSQAAGDSFSVHPHASSSHMPAAQETTDRLRQAIQSGPGSTCRPESQEDPKGKMGGHTEAWRKDNHKLNRGWQGLMRDPFALLMHLFALALSPEGCPETTTPTPLSVPFVAAGDRVMLFQASWIRLLSQQKHCYDGHA